jgi:hypothetical protein
VSLRSILAGTMLPLMAASLLWGGCAPCQQIFLSASQQGGCCLPTGQCKTSNPAAPAHKNCKSPALVLEQYVAQAGRMAHSAVAEVRVLMPNWAFVPTLERNLAVFDVLPFDSPPDLFERHSALLI